jgi:hypothetical protein
VLVVIMIVSVAADFTPASPQPVKSN